MKEKIFYKKLSEYIDYITYKGNIGRPIKKVTRKDLWRYIEKHTNKSNSR